jgi:hypothetical protein
MRNEFLLESLCLFPGKRKRETQQHTCDLAGGRCELKIAE